MSQEITFCMIKPDAVKRNLIGAMIQKLESEGLALCAGQLIRMPRDKCEIFYQEHKEKPFFTSLVEFILSGPVFVMALKGGNAVAKTRKIMGATDPAKASAGTLRALYGQSVEQNSIHGSDSLESAERELSLFFNKKELKEELKG